MAIVNKRFVPVIIGLVFVSASVAAYKLGRPLLSRGPGIEVLGARLAAAGYMIDVRYRVTDPSRARRELTRKLRPYIIDEKTGAQMIVPAPPKIGPLRQISANPRTDKNYFMFFANPSRRLKPGDRITIALGEHRIEHITIQ